MLMVAVFFAVLLLMGGELTSGLFFALALIFVEVLLVISLALFFTSFSSPFLSGIFCLGIFAAGRNADLITELAKTKSLEWLRPILEGVTAVLPNFYLFFPSGKMVEESWVTVHDQFVSTGYLASTVGYGLIYTGAFLVFSMALLSRRDFV